MNLKNRLPRRALLKTEIFNVDVDSMTSTEQNQFRVFNNRKLSTRKSNVTYRYVGVYNDAGHQFVFGTIQEITRLTSNSIGIAPTIDHGDGYEERHSTTRPFGGVFHFGAS